MNPADAARTAVLAALPYIGPARLRRLLAHHRPADALDRLVSGAGLHPMIERAIPPDQLAEVRAAARVASVDAAADALRTHGVTVIGRDEPDFPAPLVHDPGAPAALFVRGSLDVLDARRVGVIGTRNATVAGRLTAGELGEALAAEAVTVVSGLARGIDGAAHEGVQRSGGPGRPAAVVGNGPDRPYPRRHAALWEWVVTAGVLLSEWPPGTPPDAWRFPQRNRILAALCEVLVVVESRERGGSLITARAAADRGIEVMAVPGSPRVRASAGTNRLLVDGAAPVTAVVDVLTMLGLDHRRQGPLPFDPRPVPVGAQNDVLTACADGPCTLDEIAARTGLVVTEAALAAARLERAGWLIEAGGWFELAESLLPASRTVPE